MASRIVSYRNSVCQTRRQTNAKPANDVGVMNVYVDASSVQDLNESQSTVHESLNAKPKQTKLEINKISNK